MENEISARHYLAAMQAAQGREGQLMLLNSAIRAEMPWMAGSAGSPVKSKEQNMVDLYNRLKPKV
jgi:hypothetical protein